MNDTRPTRPSLARSLRDYWSVVGVVLLGVVLSVGLWQYGRGEERARVRLELEAATENYAASVQRSVRFAELLVESLRSWRSQSETPRGVGFHAFTMPLVRNLSGVAALEWVPRVRGSERREYEESMRRAGVEGFVVKERDAEGRLVSAAPRDEYFPVSDVDPGDPASPVVGFDLASEEARRSAMTRARRSGTTVATSRLRLVETRDQYGFQLFSPVFDPTSEAPTADERGEALVGFVVGVFRVSDLVEDALAPLQLLDVDMEILDFSAGPGGERLYRRASGASQPPDPEGDLEHESLLDVGGRRWLVRTRMDRAAIAARGTRNPAGLLLAGLSITTLLGVALLVNAHKTAAIRAGNLLLSTALRDGEAAHEALRDSELRFRAVIEEQTELIARWDPDERLTFVSPSLARFLARPRDALEGTTLRAALGEETAAALTEGLSSPTPEDPVGGVELSLQDSVGRSFWYSWTRRVRYDDDGRVAHFQAVGRDVTVRKRAQETLREQEERFRRLAEAAFEGIALTFEGRFVDANAQLARMLGYEVAHLLGREVAQFVAPESLPEVERRIRANDEGPYEHLALTRDGRRIPVEVRARSIVLAGRTMRISAVRDVTEQRRATEELARSRAFLDTIFTGLDLPVWVVDVAEDGSLRPVACNPACERLMGLNLAALDVPSFDALAQVLPAKDVRDERAAIERCIAAGVPLREAVSEGLLSGGERDFLRQLNPLLDPDGRVFRVIGTLIEVTELKRAERTLRDGQRLLAEAQRIARLGGWEFDLPAGPLRFSEQAWGILGEPVSTSPRDAWTWEALSSLAHESDRQAVEGALARLRAGEGVSDQELRFVRPDGSVAVILFQGETERSASGDPVRFVGTLQDVTERKRAEEAAERQRQELVQADKMIALGTLLSGVAHEINNPNHFILLNLPLLRAAWRDAQPVLDAHAETDRDFTVGGLPYHEMREEVPSLLDEVIQGAERIKFIVSELRGYTREQAHSTAPVSLNDAVRSALTLLANPIKKATRRFSVEYQEELPRVRGNLRRLEQVVINLILNACQSLGGPDRAVRVETTHDAEEGRAVVTVRDEGSGIPESALARITDPFFTTKRESGGAGLGLAVAARIAEEHGARLSFESEVGRGTTARLSLPVVEDAR